jgi:hypothetical protein
LNEVKSAVQTQADQAHLISATAPHSGAFLHAVPMTSIGTRLDNLSMRIAIALRLSDSGCASHQCVCEAARQVYMDFVVGNLHVNTLVTTLSMGS